MVLVAWGKFDGGGVFGESRGCSTESDTSEGGHEVPKVHLGQVRNTGVGHKDRTPGAIVITTSKNRQVSDLLCSNRKVDIPVEYAADPSIGTKGADLMVEVVGNIVANAVVDREEATRFRPLVVNTEIDIS